MYDSHSWSMSSDSEITSTTTANRRHHRPHSSQSRVYHAHPAPRSSHASSRNLLHCSDSTASASATYLAASSDPANSSGLADSTNSAGIGCASGNGTSNTSGVSLSQTNLATGRNAARSTLQQHLQGDSGLLAAGSQHTPQQQSAKAAAELAAQNLAAYRQQHQHQAYSPHQVSISNVVQTPVIASSFESLYDQTSPAAVAIMQQQQQQQGLARQSTGAGLRRQLPSRPLKQSMSIDHTSCSPYHHQQQASPSFVSQAIHSSLVDSYQGYGSSIASSNIGLTTQRPLSSPSDPMLDPMYKQQQQQRNFRLEMDMIEKQTMQMNLNQASQQSSAAFLHHQISPAPPNQLQQNHQSAVVGSSSSLEQLQAPKSEQQQQPQTHQYLTNDQIFHQQQIILQQQRQKHHQQQLTSYGSLSSSVTAHHQSSSPARQAPPPQRGTNEWLPPSGASAHHVPSGTSGWAPTTSCQTSTPLSSSGASHLKQTMSVDQYQPTRGHYAHVREARVVEQQQHYHRGSSRLPDGNQLPMAGPLDQLDYNYPAEQVPQTFTAQQPTDDLNQGVRSTQQQQQALYMQQQHIEFSPSKHPRQYLQGQQQLVSGIVPTGTVGSSYGLSGTVSGRAASASSKLQHQVSSSSSNSQSGSLKSSNVDLSKASNEQLRTGSLSQLQHHHHQTASLHRQQREMQQQQQQQDIQMIKLNNHNQHLKKGYTILGTTSEVPQSAHADHQAVASGTQVRPGSRVSELTA